MQSRFNSATFPVKFHNKRVRYAITFLFLLLIVLFCKLKFFSEDNATQAGIEREISNRYRSSKFNPRDSSLNVYQYITKESSAKLVSGDSKGMFFHWDDWVDLSRGGAGDEILESYRKKFPEGQCDSKLISFGDVNGYRLETYNNKLLRGLADLYCLKEIPERLIVPFENGYTEVPVSRKKRIGYKSMALNTTKEKLVTEMQKFEASRSLYPLTSYKKLGSRLDLTLEDFKFNSSKEIEKLESIEHLSKKQERYLSMLKYADFSVDHANKYFKYPWIIDDVITGHAHHFAYPFFNGYTSDQQRQSVIQHMVRAWFMFAELYDIPSWINYGNLISWAFNGVNMPWDTDVDVQIPILLLDRVGQQLNRSLILEDPRYGNAKYWFVISPTYIRQGNGKNFIDARFIEINSGLYIDISVLAQTDLTPPKSLSSDYKGDLEEIVNDKNHNFFHLKELLPIRHTYFEGGSAYIPHNVTSVLTRKYGQRSYTDIHFRGYNYQEDIELWVPNSICESSPSGKLERFAKGAEGETEPWLSLEGACGSKLLRDEYNIVHSCAERHKQLNKNLDISEPYDISQMQDLPLTRKDSWDYFYDLDSGKLLEYGWYSPQEIFPFDNKEDI